MFFRNLIHSGWLHALFIAAIAYPITSMTLKVVSSYTDTNILVYTAFIMLSCSVTLLLLSGPGALSIRTLKRPETWGYAVLQIISYILLLVSMMYISATEGAALGKMGGLFVFILSILFLNQKANKYENMGACIIGIGFLLIIYNTPLSIENKAILTIVVIARALVQCGQKMITELHKTNRKAVKFKDQLRVTGFIMAVASFVFLMFLLTVSSFKSFYEIPFFSPFPYFKDFLIVESFVLGIFLGAFIISISKYCEFYAGKTIGSKYLTSISSFELIFIFLLELAIAKTGLINLREISDSTIIALVLVLLGSVVVSIAGFMKDIHYIKKGEKQDTLANLDDNIVDKEDEYSLMKLNMANLSLLYDGNIKSLSHDMKVDFVTLNNIIKYDYGDVKIKRKVYNKINNFASKHVATKDKLTKAYNRYYLDQKVNDLFKLNTKFKIYYLDLNQFKPVNDNYGHSAGDYVLSQIVSRLKKITELKNNIFRLGGDEFVIIQESNLDKDLTSLIKDTVEKPINLKNNVVNVSTSVGVSLSNEFENLDDMLKQADSLMFVNKKESK